MEKMFVLIFASLAISAFIPIIAITFVFLPTGVPYEAQIDPEILNGIITISGLVFAFQPAIFRAKKSGFFRLMFLAIFSAEGMLIGLVGYNYVFDALNLGNYLSGNTLFLATSSLFFNITMSAHFVLSDLVIEAEGPFAS